MQNLISIAVVIIILGVAWLIFTEPVSKILIIEEDISDYSQLPSQVNKKITYKHGGKMLCTAIKPGNQCEVAVDCETGEEREGITLAEFLGISTNPKISVPGQACATFDIDINDPKNPCRYVGRRIYCP